MNPTPLEITRMNYEDHLRGALETINGGRGVAASYFMAAFSHRVLAICSLLLEGDRFEFGSRLCRSGHAWLSFLERVRSGWSVPPKFLCLSKDVATASALTAGDLEIARRIAAASSTRCDPRFEYEDDHLPIRFFHCMLAVSDGEEEVGRVLDRWEEVLAGGPSQFLDVCRTLVAADAEGFQTAFDAFLEMRASQLQQYQREPAHDAELLAAEGQVYIEGLAVLRIAEVVGLPTRRDYPLIPELARLPQRVEMSDPDAWRAI